MSVLSVAKQLNKAYKTDFIHDGSVIPTYQKVSMGSVAADFAVNGGIPLGAITCFAGPEGSGKTTAAVQVVAEYQKAFPDKTCLFLDCERSFFVQKDFFAKMTGVIIDDPKRLLIMDTSGLNAEEIFSMVVKFQQEEDIGLIVLDSAPALVSASDMETDFKKDNGMRSSVSKVLGRFLKTMVMYLPKRNNALLVINQVRDGGKTSNGIQIWTEPCGYGLKFYPSLKIRFGTRSFTKDDNADLTMSKAEEADGFRLKFSMTKSRLSKVKGNGFITYKYDTGRDVTGDTLEVALKYGFIERPTMQTYVLVDTDTGEVLRGEDGEDLKFVGRKKLIEYLNTHEKFRDEYVSMLKRAIDGSNETHSLLDEATMKEIMDQEASVEGQLTREEITERELLESGDNG